MLPPIITRRQRSPPRHQKSDDDIALSSSTKSCDHYHHRHNNQIINTTTRSTTNEKAVTAAEPSNNHVTLWWPRRQRQRQQQQQQRRRRGGEGKRRPIVFWNVIHPFITYARKNGDNNSIVVVSLISCIVVALIAMVFISIVMIISFHGGQQHPNHRYDDMRLLSTTARNYPPPRNYNDSSLSSSSSSKLTSQEKQQQQQLIHPRNPQHSLQDPNHHHHHDHHHHQNEQNQMNELYLLAMEEEERLQSAAAAAHNPLPPPTNEEDELSNLIGLEEQQQQQQQPSWTSDERLSYHHSHSSSSSSRLEIPLSPSTYSQGMIIAWIKLSSLSSDGKKSSSSSSLPRRRIIWMTTTTTTTTNDSSSSSSSDSGGCADGSAVSLLYITNDGMLSWDYTTVDGSCVTISSSSSSSSSSIIRDDDEAKNNGWIMVVLEWETTLTMTMNDDSSSKGMMRGGGGDGGNNHRERQQQQQQQQNGVMTVTLTMNEKNVAVVQQSPHRSDDGSSSSSSSDKYPPARIYPRSKCYLGSDDKGRQSLEGYIANVGVIVGGVRRPIVTTRKKQQQRRELFVNEMFRSRTGSEMVEMMRDAMMTMENGCDDKQKERGGGGEEEVVVGRGCAVAFYSLREFQDTASSSSPPSPILVESIQGLNGRRLPLPLALSNNNNNNNNNGGPYTISFITDSTSSTTHQRTVAAALHHAFHSYHQQHQHSSSKGCDILHPLSYHCPDDDTRGSVSLIAALDALYVTSPDDDFVKAQRFIEKNGLWHSKKTTTAVTVTTVSEDSVVEVLAGLLAGYDVSRDEGLLSLAVELGRKILVDLDQQHQRRGEGGDVTRNDDDDHKEEEEVWIDLTRMTMEWRYLGYLTGEDMFESVVTERINRLTSTWSSSSLHNNDNKPGHRNNKWTSVDGTVLLKGVTCLLRLWLLGGKREVLLRAIYDDVMDEIHERMVRRTDLTGLVYLEYPKRVMGEVEEMWEGAIMDHDDCAMAGTLALGAHTHPDGLTSTNAQRDLLTATSLATTCHEMYTRTVSGLSPHLVKIKPGGDFATPPPSSSPTSSTSSNNDNVFFDLNSYYDLSPSFIESLFILHQLTQNNIYRDWGWSLFLSIERYAKITKGGYGYVVNVNDERMEDERVSGGEGGLKGFVGDEMAVWFMGRTLKFLYLLFFEGGEKGKTRGVGGGVDVLTTHVMNTRSHPMRIIKAKKRSQNRDGSRNTRFK